MLSEEFRIIAKKWVEADAAANMLEESKSAVLAKMISAQGDMPVNRAETRVKSSTEWSDYIKSMVEARERASMLKVQLEYIRMRFSEWQSHEANRRAEMKL
jgi:viroplasmin and RNaseH domain-containing protein